MLACRVEQPRGSRLQLEGDAVINRSTALAIGLLVFGGISTAIVWPLFSPQTPVEPDLTTRESALVAAHSPSVGPADAAVTLVEFFDPMCEGCAAFHPIVKAVLAEFPQDVRLVYRYLAFHRGSEQAVRLLEAARTQGKFEAVLDALIARHDEWASHGRENLEAAWEIAATTGLDMVEARAAAPSDEIARILERELAAAGVYRIQQTPTVFVNGEQLRQYTREELTAVIQRQL
jgi:protein-disulfide isomerase